MTRHLVHLEGDNALMFSVCGKAHLDIEEDCERYISTGVWRRRPSAWFNMCARCVSMLPLHELDCARL